MPHDIATDLHSIASSPNRCRAARTTARWTTLGGILSALGVCSACCLLPAILIAFGLTGAWVGRLERLAAYKPHFLIATTVLLGVSFYLVYFRRSLCSAGTACATCRRPSAAARIGLWIGALLVVAGLIFETVAPLL
jgi:mercuric ion transport protein